MRKVLVTADLSNIVWTQQPFFANGFKSSVAENILIKSIGFKVTNGGWIQRFKWTFPSRKKYQMNQ